MTSFAPGTNRDYAAAYNDWWFGGAQGEAPNRKDFGPDDPQSGFTKGKFQKDHPDELDRRAQKQYMINHSAKDQVGWRDFYNNARQNIISGGQVTRGLGARTSDFQDSNRNGVDDRDERPQITSDWWYSNGSQNNQGTIQDPGNSQAPRPRATDFGRDYSPATGAGDLYNQGWGNMVSWGNKFQDNETIQNYISGSRLDSNRTMMNMGLDLQYQKGQMANMAQYQGGMENLRTGNTLKLLAAEGGIVNQLMDNQGRIESRQIGERGDQERRGLRVAGQENRAGIGAQGDQDRRSLTVRGKQERMGMMEQGSQNRMGMAAQGIEDRALTRTRGDQDRKTQRDKYREERKMRADARGAVRSSGARFFG